eukprot:gene12930-3686_t
MDLCSKPTKSDLSELNHLMKDAAEYQRLRTLIPQLAAKHTVSKIEVVEEAINYIAQLQRTLSNLHQVPSEELQQQFLEREKKRRRLIRERTKKVPSYQQQKRRRKATTLSLRSKEISQGLYSCLPDASPVVTFVPLHAPGFITMIYK